MFFVRTLGNDEKNANSRSQFLYIASITRVLPRYTNSTKFKSVNLRDEPSKKPSR
jgi:hypothetical protein